MLLSKFSQVAKNEVPFEPRHRDFLALYPHQEADIRKNARFFLTALEKRLNCFDDLRVDGHEVTHADFVLG